MKRKSASRTIDIHGRVVVTGGTSAAGLRVQAWAAGVAFARSLASGEPDANGVFDLALDPAVVREAFGEAAPRVFFKVLRGRKVVASTEGSVEWTAGVEARAVRIRVEAPAPDAARAASPALEASAPAAPAAPLAHWKIDTGVRYNHRKVYRLIGRDLYSARTAAPLAEQQYVLEKAEVIAPELAASVLRVVIEEGAVRLEK